jgi:hypothetical protein
VIPLVLQRSRLHPLASPPPPTPITAVSASR